MRFERHIGSLWVRVLAAVLVPLAALAALLQRGVVDSPLRGRLPAAQVGLGLLALLSVIHSAAPLYAAWMGVARRLGNLVTTLLFGAIYLLIVPPFSVVMRVLDPLRLRRRSGDSYWIRRRQGPTDLSSLQRMG